MWRVNECHSYRDRHGHSKKVIPSKPGCVPKMKWHQNTFNLHGQFPSQARTFLEQVLQHDKRIPMTGWTWATFGSHFVTCQHCLRWLTQYDRMHTLPFSFKSALLARKKQYDFSTLYIEPRQEFHSDLLSSRVTSQCTEWSGHDCYSMTPNRIQGLIHCLFNDILSTAEVRAMCQLSW
jgi:hypothetical protein